MRTRFLLFLSLILTCCLSSSLSSSSNSYRGRRFIQRLSTMENIKFDDNANELLDLRRKNEALLHEKKRSLLKRLSRSIENRRERYRLNPNLNHGERRAIEAAEKVLLELGSVTEESSSQEMEARLRSAMTEWMVVPSRSNSFLELDSMPNLESVLPNAAGEAEKATSDMLTQVADSAKKDASDKSQIDDMNNVQNELNVAKARHDAQQIDSAELDKQVKGILGQASDSYASTSSMSCEGRYDSCVRTSEIVRRRCIEAFKMSTSSTARGTRREQRKYFMELTTSATTREENRKDEDYPTGTEKDEEEIEEEGSESQSGPSDITALQNDMVDAAIANMDAMSY